MPKYRLHKQPVSYAEYDLETYTSFLKSCAMDRMKNKNLELYYLSILKLLNIDTTNGPMQIWTLTSLLDDPDLDVVAHFTLNSMAFFYKDGSLYCCARDNSRAIDREAIWTNVRGLSHPIDNGFIKSCPRKLRLAVFKLD